MNDKRFYVYGHYDGDELVYIGMGQKGRAFDCRSDTTRQLNEHTLFMTDKLTNGDVSFVKFFAVKLSKEDAEYLEKQLIQQHDPKYNLAHTSRKKVYRGEENTKALLSEDDVFLIKYFILPECKMRRIDIGKLFQVHQATINDIFHNRSWRHV